MLEVGVVLVVGVVRACVEGHGRLVDPPARSTMWRLGFDTPVHYNDHQLYCGGYKRQWVQNRGRCGVCGDPWDLPRPRPHEAGGTWGTGVISRVYREGQVMVATVHLTTNHLGWFEFRLCPNNDPGRYVRQKCLNKHVLNLVQHPGTRYYLKQSQTGLFRIPLQLPPGLTCSQCVVQWHYTTGNNWGICKDGRNQAGCGPQEVFRGCSDIAVFGRDDPGYYRLLNLTAEPDLSKFLRLKEEGEEEEEAEVAAAAAVVVHPTRDGGDGDGLRRRDGPLASHTNGFVDPFDKSGEEEEEEEDVEVDRVSKVEQSNRDDFDDRFDQIFQAGRGALAQPLATRPEEMPTMTTTLRHHHHHHHSHPDPTPSPSITLFDKIGLDDHRKNKNDLPLTTRPPLPPASLSQDDLSVKRGLFTPSPKTRASTDEFRTLRIGRRRHIPAPVTFLTPPTNTHREPRPVATDSYTSGGVTPSLPAPSLDLPTSTKGRVSTVKPRRTQSVRSHQSLDLVLVPEATARVETGHATPSAGGGRPAQRQREGQGLQVVGSLPVVRGVVPLAIQILHSHPSLVTSGTSGRTLPLILQASLPPSLASPTSAQVSHIILILV